MKKVDEDLELLTYMTKLERTLSVEEFTLVKSAFYLVRDNYAEDQYYDIIQTCCETVYESKDKGLSCRNLFQNMLVNIIKKVSCEAKIGIPFDHVKDTPREDGNFDSTEMLRGLLALFDMDSMDKVKDEIFLKVLSGEDKSAVASFYHTTVRNVESIYQEKLAVVNGVRVVNGKVFVDEVENYSEKLNEKLAEIGTKVHAKDQLYQVR